MYIFLEYTNFIVVLKRHKLFYYLETDPLNNLSKSLATTQKRDFVVSFFVLSFCHFTVPFSELLFIHSILMFKVGTETRRSFEKLFNRRHTLPDDTSTHLNGNSRLNLQNTRLDQEARNFFRKTQVFQKKSFMSQHNLL